MITNSYDMKSIQGKQSRLNVRTKLEVQRVFVEVVLGRPNANCKHLGICKIERVEANDLRHLQPSFCDASNRLFALATYKEQHYFELTFERAFIAKHAFEIHFQKGLFSVQEAYYVELGISESPIFIDKGDYKIDSSDTMLSVYFPLT